MKKFFVLIVGVLLVGCVATGPGFSNFMHPDSGSGIIYVYRPSSIVNSGMAPDLYINGVEKAKLNDGGYQVYNVSPGEYKIAIDGNLLTWTHGRSEVDISLKEEQVVFIRLGAEVDETYIPSGVAFTGANFIQVTKELAVKEIVDTKLSM